MVFAYYFLNMILCFLMVSEASPLSLSFSVFCRLVPRYHVTVLPQWSGGRKGSEGSLAILILCHKVAGEFTLPKRDRVLDKDKVEASFYQL